MTRTQANPNATHKANAKDAFIFYSADKPNIEHTLLLSKFCRKHGHKPELVNIHKSPLWELHRLPKYKNATLQQPLCKLGDAWYKVDTTERCRIAMEDSTPSVILPQGVFEPHTHTDFWDKLKYAIRQTTAFKDLRLLFPDTLEIGSNQECFNRTVVRVYYNSYTARYRADIRQQGVSCSLQRNSIDDMIDAVLQEM